MGNVKPSAALLTEWLLSGLCDKESNDATPDDFDFFKEQAFCFLQGQQVHESSLDPPVVAMI